MDKNKNTQQLPKSPSFTIDLLQIINLSVARCLHLKMRGANLIELFQFQISKSTHDFVRIEDSIFK